MPVYAPFTACLPAPSKISFESQYKSDYLEEVVKGSKKIIAAGGAVLATAGLLLANAITGPSSSQSPYILRSMPGVVTKAIMTVGDSVNLKPGTSDPYRMVGIPDGLGAFDNGDGTFTLLMNHELTNTSGVVRAHGAKGAFVSKWTIRKDDLTVLNVQDLMQNVKVWNGGAFVDATDEQKTFTRFCSADLAPISAFYDANSNTGYNGRIFMNGEESGTEGRAMAHLLNGTSYELPWLGKAAWENSIANPGTGPKTVVALTDDGAGGQVYFYVGLKNNSANPVEAAGLTNGHLFSINVAGLTTESDATAVDFSASFAGHDFGDVSGLSGAALNAASVGNVTSFNRPEDGAWDPNNPNDFYFVTTASITGKSRLWRVRFNDASNPMAGGTVTALLNGTEGQKMMDNITFNNRGQIVIQEDPGNNSYIAKIRLYDIASDTLTEVAHHDENRFTGTATNSFNQDEESSGVIDASAILGEGWYLLVQQAHYSTDTELAEGGQLLALHIPAGKLGKSE
jgi:WD40 repeat protein